MVFYKKKLKNKMFGVSIKLYFSIQRCSTRTLLLPPSLMFTLRKSSSFARKLTMKQAIRITSDPALSTTLTKTISLS